MNFKLRVPFKLARGRAIEVPYQLTIAKKWTANIEKENTYYVLIISGFPTRVSARRFLRRALDALDHMLITRGLSWRIDGPLREAYQYPNPKNAGLRLRQEGYEVPEIVHGTYDYRYPAILPSEAFYLGTPGEAGLGIGIMSGRTFLEAFAEGVDCGPIIGKRIRQSVEVLRDSAFDRANGPRFLSIMTALEVLAPVFKRPAYARRLIDVWHAQANERARRMSNRSRTYSDLGQAVKHLEEASKAARIKRLVRATLGTSEGERKAGKLWGKRGALVHEGILPREDLHELVCSAEGLVRDILAKRLKAMRRRKNRNLE